MRPQLSHLRLGEIPLRLTRRTLLGGCFLALSPVVFADQTGDVNLEPTAGEILLEGKIIGGSRKERKMTLLVDAITSPGGASTPLAPPRPRDVQLTDKTGIVNLAYAEQALVPEGLMLDLRVKVIGQDLGTGQLVSARLVLVDASTLEQRTLLERGQMAVATQTFTLLGKKAWWNFRCSDAAKATMSAYRTGLKMTVDRAANQYDVQFQQGDIDIAEGDIVTIHFRAKADRERKLHLEAQSTGGDYPDIGLARDIPLTRDWQDFSYSFTAHAIGKRNQFVFGIGQDTGSVWLEGVNLAAAPSGGAKPVSPKATAAVAKSGTTAFTGLLVTQIDLFSLIGKRYDFARGGEQPFTLMLTSEDEPTKLVPITLTAQKSASTITSEDGPITVRTLDWKRAGEDRPIGYLMIGPEGEMIKSEEGAAFFAEPLYRMQGPATKTKTGFDMQMLEPYRDRWRVEKTTTGWKVSVLLSNGVVAGFVETDEAYNPTKVHCPISGDITARVFSATIAGGKIVWDMPLAAGG